MRGDSPFSSAADEAGSKSREAPWGSIKSDKCRRKLPAVVVYESSSRFRHRSTALRPVHRRAWHRTTSWLRFLAFEHIRACGWSISESRMQPPGHLHRDEGSVAAPARNSAHPCGVRADALSPSCACAKVDGVLDGDDVASLFGVHLVDQQRERRGS